MQDPSFTTDSMEELFGPMGRVRAWLEVEAVLAESQADVGVIPDSAALAIAMTCRQLEPDPDQLLAQGWDQGTLILPLLDLIRSRLSEEHHDYLHRDTTTQDIIDTALTFRAAQGIERLEVAIRDVGKACVALADEHRASWMTGRTFLQAARPTTFGAKAALWLDALTSRWRDLAETRVRLFLQLGGPVGLGTGMLGRTPEVTAAMAQRLGLRASAIPWQSDREPIVGLATSVARVARAVEKVASDLMILGQTEVGEVRMRPGGSTAMKHKRNPVDASRAVTASRVVVSAAGGLLQAPPPRLERDAGVWMAEWHLMAEIFGSTDVSLRAVLAALTSIEVDPIRMGANLDSALGMERPDLGDVDRLIDSAITGFDEARTSQEESAR